MNAKTVTSAILIGMLATSAVARGQGLGSTVQPPPIRRDMPDGPEALPPPVGTPGAVPPGMVAPSLGGLSDWITYRRPDCCSSGPLSPLYSEAFLRVGPCIAVGGNYLGRELQVGWAIEGGIRGLLFNPETTRAWVAEFHIINSNNSGGGGQDPVVLDILRLNQLNVVTRQNVPVTVLNFNRTMAGVGGGREWYLWQPADSPGSKWRIGVDAGGRYGTSSMTFNEIRHRTDVVAGVFASAHTDFEVPCGRCYLSWGLRAEWGYTWGNILQRTSDVQELNTLVTFGVRY
jgi:hypothetical protein